MKITTTNNILTIELTSDEQMEYTVKDRDHYGKEQQVWIKITEKNHE